MHAVVDPIIGIVTENLEYEKGRTAAHVLNDGQFEEMDGGLYLITIKALRDDFQQIAHELESFTDKDLKHDLKLLNQMMPEFLDSAVKDLPVIGNHFAYNTIHAVIGAIASLVLGGIFGKRVSEFQEAIPKLATNETKIFPGNMKMDNGFHTISLSVTRREEHGKSVYDLMIANTGAASDWHMLALDVDDDSAIPVVIPFILE